eukprot:gene14971-10709_t
MEPTANEEKSQMHLDPLTELSRVEQLLRQYQQRDAQREEEIRRIQQERDDREEEIRRIQQERDDREEEILRIRQERDDREEEILRIRQERDDKVNELHRQIQQDRAKQQDECLQSQQQRDELKDKMQRSDHNLRLMGFPFRLVSEPPRTLVELLTRIGELNLPKIDHEESLSEAVAAAFQSKPPTSAGTLRNLKIDMSTFNYLWLSDAQKQRMPYLQLQLKEEAIETVLVSHFFHDRRAEYDRVRDTFAEALRRLREVCLFFAPANPRYPHIEERKHLTPMATLFVKALIDELSFSNAQLSTAVGLQVDIERLAGTNVVEEDTTTKMSVEDCYAASLKWSVPLVGPEDMTKTHEVTGHADILISSATTSASTSTSKTLACVVELKLPSRLMPSQAQTLPRGQVFAEMMGLKCYSPDLPLHVGVLTDLFSFYVLLMDGPHSQQDGIASTPVYISDNCNRLPAAAVPSDNPSLDRSLQLGSSSLGTSHYVFLRDLPVVPYQPPPANVLRMADAEEEYDALMEDTLWFRRFNALINGESYLSERDLQEHQARYSTSV